MGGNPYYMHFMFFNESLINEMISEFDFKFEMIYSSVPYNNYYLNRNHINDFYRRKMQLFEGSLTKQHTYSYKGRFSPCGGCFPNNHYQRCYKGNLYDNYNERCNVRNKKKRSV